jgi:hypothetical protein
MTGTNCDLFTHKSSRSYLKHLVNARTVYLYFIVFRPKHIQVNINFTVGETLKTQMGCTLFLTSCGRVVNDTFRPLYPW